MNSLLIVRLGAIGDVIHALPAAALIRRRRPDIRLGWLVEPAAASLLRGNPMLDATLVWPRKQWRREGLGAFGRRTRAFFREEVRAGAWDTALDLQGLLKSGAATWMSGARERVGFGGEDSREGNFLFMSRRATPPAELRHVIERNIFLAAAAIRDEEALNLAASDSEGFRALAESLTLNPPLPPLEEARKSVGHLLGAEDARPLVVLNPGGAWASKRWAPERFGQLARLLGQDNPRPRFAIALGPREEEMAAAMRREASGGADFVDLPALDFLQLAALCQRASLFVAGDTGPLHLASAMGAKCVGLYAGSDPARNGPYGSDNRIVDAQRGQARRVHYRKDRAGLSAVEPEEVAAACRELLYPAE